MLSGLIGKSVTSANVYSIIALPSPEAGYPIVANVHLTNTTSFTGVYTFSIMDSADSAPTPQDNIFINSTILPNASINLGNFVMSYNESIALLCNIAGIAMRVSGIQSPN